MGPDFGAKKRRLDAAGASAVLSDEELARRLHEELNANVTRLSRRSSQQLPPAPAPHAPPGASETRKGMPLPLPPKKRWSGTGGAAPKQQPHGPHDRAHDDTGGSSSDRSRGSGSEDEEDEEGEHQEHPGSGSDAEDEGKTKGHSSRQQRDKRTRGTSKEGAAKGGIEGSGKAAGRKRGCRELALLLSDDIILPPSRQASLPGGRARGKPGAQHGSSSDSGAADAAEGGHRRDGEEESSREAEQHAALERRSESGTAAAGGAEFQASPSSSDAKPASSGGAEGGNATDGQGAAEEGEGEGKGARGRGRKQERARGGGGGRAGERGGRAAVPRSPKIRKMPMVQFQGWLGGGCFVGLK